MSTKNYNPLQAAGMEGMSGLFVCITLLIIFNNIPCSPVHADKGQIALCPFGVIENTLFAFRQMDYKRILAGLVAASILIATIEDTVGICIVKNGSAVQRAITKCCRSLCVWVISMIIGWEHFLVPQVFFILLTNF